MKAENDEVYILHSRPFKETSQLTDLLTKQHGRLRVVHRGGKQKKIQPFTLAVASWSGKGDLKTLRTIEPVSVALSLQGVKLFSALYVNELLTKVLHEHDPHQQLFDGYRELLQQLTQTVDGVDISLRTFERSILVELGYGYDYNVDARSGEPILSKQWYWFEPEQGLISGQRLASNANRSNWFLGKNLQALAAGDYQKLEVRQVSKQLNQLALNDLLGGKTLNSSEFFRQSKIG